MTIFFSMSPSFVFIIFNLNLNPLLALLDHDGEAGAAVLCNQTAEHHGPAVDFEQPGQERL